MSPLVAVVVPVYRQPQFLTGAVLSALATRPPVDVRVVIVDDGCPFPSTHETATALHRAHPDRVAYVRQANAGLSAARNAGVERALAQWPQLDAIFPLDADNLLSPWTLGALWDRLDADPGVDWASPSLEQFGGADDLWECAPPFTVYRQLFENQCDAGTLFRRRAFEHGLRYDERLDMLEDWLFVLQAARLGLTGVQAGPCGFRYRVRTGSKLAAGRAGQGKPYDLIRSVLPEAYAAAELVRREHAEAPRFALVDDRRRVRSLAAVDLEPRECGLGEWVDLVGASHGGDARDAPYVAPITVLGAAPLFAWLDAARLLPGVLLNLQAALQAAPLVALTLGSHPDADTLALAIGEPVERKPAALCVRTRELHRLEELAAAEIAPVLSLRVGAAHAPPTLERLPWRALAGAVTAARAAAPPTRAGRTLSAFAGHLHIDEQESTFPHSGANGEDAVWLVGGPAAGGAELAAGLRLAGHYRATRPGASLHLALVDERPRLAVAPAALSPFDSVTLLDAASADAWLPRLLANAGVVVRAGSAAASAALAARGTGPAGPVQVALSAEAGDSALDDALLDAYLVPSEDERMRLENLGAVPDKITTLAGWDDIDAVVGAVATARGRRSPA